MIEFPGKQLAQLAVGTAVRRSLRCLFVLSTGRVGTVTLTKLLSLSPKILARHEPGPLLLEETKRAYQQHPLSAKEGTRLARVFATARARALFRTVRRTGLYAECSNRLTYLAPALANYFPRSRFIHLYRDPAATVRSGMRRRWYVDHPWDGQRIAPLPDDPWAEHWNEWGPFERCCWFWNAVNEFALDMVDLLPPDRVYSTSMESLFASHDAAERVFTWLGIDVPPRDDIQRVIAKPYNAQRENRFPSWSEWTPEQKEQLERIASSTARRLKYLTYAERP